VIIINWYVYFKSKKAIFNCRELGTSEPRPNANIFVNNVDFATSSSLFRVWKPCSVIVVGFRVVLPQKWAGGRGGWGGPGSGIKPQQCQQHKPIAWNFAIVPFDLSQGIGCSAQSQMISQLFGLTFQLPQQPRLYHLEKCSRGFLNWKVTKKWGTYKFKTYF